MSRRKQKRTFEFVCGYCKRNFTAGSEKARYCCSAHKQAAYRLRLEVKA